MFDVVAKLAGTLDGQSFGPPDSPGLFSPYLLHSKLSLLAGIAAAGVLIVILFARYIATRSREQRELESYRRGVPPPPGDPTVDLATLLGSQFRWRGRTRFGLPWKIIKTFAGTTLIVGLFIIGAVYLVMIQTVQRQFDQRALTIATNLSDTGVTHVLAKDPRALHRVLAKYAQLWGVAYVFVEDRKGKVLGHSPGEFPAELESLLGGGDLREVRRAATALAGRKLYDTRVPLLNGEIGAVHVGVWKAGIDREVDQALFPVVVLLLIILIAAVVFAIIIAGKLSKPILRLAQSADQISRGQLDLPVGIESNDELGDLGRSVERLRASLKAAIVRLDREPS